MAQGPFQSYAPPGVYTTTKNATSISGPSSGVQVPLIVGTGLESFTRTDLELVRGSAANFDQLITAENVSDRAIVDVTNPSNPILGAVDGATSLFKVQNFPIVSGDGSGSPTNRPQDVSVTVDDVAVVVARVDGTQGEVQLQIAPPLGSTIKVTYYFSRSDTQVTDDVSAQVSPDPAVLQATGNGPYTVTTGINDAFTVIVNGVSSSLILGAGTKSASDIAIEINAAQIVGLTATADIDNQGQSRLQLSATGSLVIGAGTANTLFGFLEGQATNRTKAFRVYNGPITDGSGGGITTTNSSDVTVLVNGIPVPAQEVDGTNRLVTLEQAPVVNSTVVITYAFNTYQNTFDYLPDVGITAVGQIGNSPGRSDYTEGLDFIVKDDRIVWGSAALVSSGTATLGATEIFDDSQVGATLRDDRVFMDEVTRYQDASLIPPRASSTIIVLNDIPVVGDGRGIATNDPSKVQVYHGPSIQVALTKGPVTVVNVEASTRRVTLGEPIPEGHTVWATYWYSRLDSDKVTLTRTNSGRFTAYSDVKGAFLFNTRFGTSAATDTIEWPSGSQSDPDAFHVGTSGVNETVTVTFSQVGEVGAEFTNIEAGPYDVYANASDTFHMVLNDGGRGVVNDAAVADMNQAAPAVLVSAPHAAGSTYTVGAGDSFAWSLDGTNYDVAVPTGAYTISALAEYLNRGVPSTATLTGTIAETFDLTTASDYNVTINGTNVTGTLAVATATETAAQVAAALNAAIVADSGGTLSTGVLTDPANDFLVTATGAGEVVITASETLVFADAGGLNDLEDLVGFPVAVPVTNTRPVRTWEGGDREYLLLRSLMTPLGPADVSSVRVLSGTLNDTLGFSTFQEAVGTEGAVNKGATLVSATDISATDISNLAINQNDFVVSVDGLEYTVLGTSFAAVLSVSDIANQISAVLAAVATVAAEGEKIRITSLQVDSTSSVTIGLNDANQYLKFSTGDTAGQRRPTAAEVVAVLNTSAGFANTTVIDLSTLTAPGEVLHTFYASEVSAVGAGNFVKLASFNTGVDTSIAFADGTDSILNDTGIGISVGDTASGAQGVGGFVVTSTNPNGSTGAGIVGTTYTDATTGLRFSVMPAADGAYTNAESFTLVVEDNMLTGSSVLNKAIPGITLRVTSLSNVTTGDSVIVDVFSKDGNEPSVGDFYYVTYAFQKTGFEIQYFTRIAEVIANYGPLSPDNALTLAASLCFQNGASVVACLQVPKAPGSSQATDADYITAIESLSKPPSSGARPSLVIPLTGSTQVMAAYTKFSEIQASPRFRNEFRVMFGLPSGTLPSDATAIAKGLKSERALLVYPDSAILEVENELGQATQFIVDGTFVASALAGVIVSPANDVATPLTRKKLVGFVRLNRSLEEPEMNSLAINGVTALEDVAPFIQVRHGITTNPDNVLTSIPSVIATKDFVQQQVRAALDKYIGLKFLQGRAQDVEVTTTKTLGSLVDKNIIVAYKGVSVVPDPNDPTLLNVEAFYSPVFPLLYVSVRFTISASLSL